MYQKYLALAVAGVLSLGLLASCAPSGGKEEPPVTTPTATVTPEVTPAPTDTPAPSETVSPVETTPPPTPTPTAKPSPTVTPKPIPTPTQAPTPTQPPAATPTPAPDAAGVLSTVWDEIAKGDLPSLMDVDTATLKDLYGLTDADVETFLCKLPMMSANIHEFFLAKVVPGRMDAVKAACQKRQENLAGGFLYPSQTELVNNYKIVTSGDYILFCITDDPDGAVSAFNSYTK